MKKKKIAEYLLILAVILAEVLLILFFTGTWIDENAPGIFYHRPRIIMLLEVGFLTAVLSASYLLFTRFTRWLLAIAGVVLAGTVAALCLFPARAVYTETGSAPPGVFAGHRVMLIVPHEDDDINVFSGVLEQYVAAGSEVYVVYATNGDFGGRSDSRIQEAIACMTNCGVPEDNLIFLGYGDQWGDTSIHIYNMPEDMVIASNAGYTETHGIPGHAAYREGNPYTFGNYLGDMKNVILEYRPDILFCVDCDSHTDHQAVSLTFEKAMGRILQTVPDYHPTVLKGFAYSTAWNAAKDFYALNIRSAQCPSGEQMEEVNYYRWADRLRLPVKTDTLSRSIFSTAVFSQLDFHVSQKAVVQATAICNGDKVFWQRHTTSAAYAAQVTASSGNAQVVTDFMLQDKDHLRSPTPGGGVWIPDTTDSEKALTLTLPEPADISWIYLYDNPSAEDNITDACITLADGTSIHTGPLDIYGCATQIPVNARGTETFTVEILSAEGAYAGLSEIELYTEAPESGFDFIKLMDSREDFVYDYYMEDDSIRLSLYCSGKAPDLSAGGYTLQVDNDKCRAALAGNSIEIFCPKGQECVLRIESADGKYTDSVLLRNRRTLLPASQKLEQLVLNRIIEKDTLIQGKNLYEILFH